jgi:hypothetical protein
LTLAGWDLPDKVALVQTFNARNSIPPARERLLNNWVAASVANACLQQLSVRTK